ncbi:hypothetical protein Emag_003931 [Eimeria magna]
MRKKPADAAGMLTKEQQQHELQPQEQHKQQQQQQHQQQHQQQPKNCLSRSSSTSDSSSKGVAPEDVGYVNAHGTSTPYNDKFETAAFKKAFGDHAKRLLISSTKPMTGHCLGGTGGIETVVAAKVLETGSVPPTLNYKTPDPECDLNYVPNQAVHVKEPMKVGSSSNGSRNNNSSSSSSSSSSSTGSSS